VTVGLSGSGLYWTETAPPAPPVHGGGPTFRQKLLHPACLSARMIYPRPEDRGR